MRQPESRGVELAAVLGQAGATAVVPETLEPSLQLASAVLSQLNMPSDEVAQAVQNFRKNHVAELQVRVALRSGRQHVSDLLEPLQSWWRHQGCWSSR